MTPEIEVSFQPHGKRAKFPQGVTVMEAAQALGVDISSLCGGKGKCGKCKVRVIGDLGTASEPTDIEMKHLSEEEIRAIDLNGALRFNQGDAFFAGRIDEPPPATPPGVAEDTVMSTFIKAMKEGR